MVNYSNSKIYKLQCNDGYFYIGSTTSELRKRLREHKTNNSNTSVYNHINSIGWNNVKIILIENFECNNRDELRMYENEYIQNNILDPLCLNTYNAYQSEEQRKNYCNEKAKNRYIEKREEILDYGKKYRENNKNALREYQQQYREKNRERLSKRDKLYRESKKDK